jgi:plasmid stabilization system protein ParE
VTRIVWSPLAIARVAEAAEFISADKPEAAARWADSVFEAVTQLEPFPFSGSVVPELERDDVRELIHGEYRIIYRIEDERVMVLTVRHGRRLVDETELEEA